MGLVVYQQQWGRREIHTGFWWEKLKERNNLANKHTTHPLAVATRLKPIELRNSTSITFHWVKGHAGLKGNERADYLAKIAASYNTTIAYDAIPIHREKQILEEYYIKIWNANT